MTRVLAVIGAVLIAVGALSLVLGHLVLPWADDVSFLDVRNIVDDHTSGFSSFVQIYVLFLWIPFVVVPCVLAPLMWLGPRSARFTGLAAGMLGALLVGGATVWVLVGNVGTDESRSEFMPLLVGMAIGAVLLLSAGIGVSLERTGYAARAALLVGCLALLGVHVALLDELFENDSSFGAWLPLVGYVLLGLGPMLPLRHRRRQRAPR